MNITKTLNILESAPCTTHDSMYIRISPEEYTQKLLPHGVKSIGNNERWVRMLNTPYGGSFVCPVEVTVCGGVVTYVQRIAQDTNGAKTMQIVYARTAQLSDVVRRQIKILVDEINPNGDANLVFDDDNRTTRFQFRDTTLLLAHVKRIAGLMNGNIYTTLDSDVEIDKMGVYRLLVWT